MMIIELVIGGLVIGSVYSLVALAHSLIWSGVRVVNFAQSEIFMAAAFVALTVMLGGRLPAQPFPVSMLMGVAIASLIGLLIYSLIITPALSKVFLYVIGGCVGTSILVQNTAILMWGSTGMRFPAVFPVEPIQISGILVVPQDMCIMIISLATMVVLWLFLTRTKIGTAMRAAAQNRTAASLMGISYRLTDALTIAVASSLAGLAGILLAPKFYVTPQMGTIISSKGFTAAVLGGFGSMPGAVLGGLLLGVLESLSAGVISSGYKDAIAFMVMIGILMFKPGGLLGSKGGRRA